MQTLKTLLQAAKETSADYELAKKRYKKFDQMLVDANNKNTEAMFRLYHKIDERLPLVMVAKNGKRLPVKIAGALTKKSIFNYTDDENNFVSYDLLKIDRFEAIEISDASMLVFGASNLEALRAAYGNLTLEERENMSKAILGNSATKIFFKPNE